MVQPFSTCVTRDDQALRTCRILLLLSVTTAVMTQEVTWFSFPGAAYDSPVGA